MLVCGDVVGGKVLDVRWFSKFVLGIFLFF